MKVGLLAFHYAINFGAVLQLLSTVRHLSQRGIDVVVINYVAADSEDYYARTASVAQRALHAALRRELWRETVLCRTVEDIRAVVALEQLDGVIIGSDAVCQHHPWLERLTFPCRRLIAVRGTTTPEQFPNGYWLRAPLTTARGIVPVALISASCQDSRYHLFSSDTCRQMRSVMESYCYLSVRDSWTQAMVRHVMRGRLVPPITPDPVWALSLDDPSAAPLPKGKYLVATFDRAMGVTNEWLEELRREAREQLGAEIILLPFANAPSYPLPPREKPEGEPRETPVGAPEERPEEPLSPLHWYRLIANSEGYIGANMHPVIVALANAKPVYSFDNYGHRYLNGLLTSDRSSKIKHILTQAGLSANRVSALSRRFTPPSPTIIIRTLAQTDRSLLARFAARQRASYDSMIDKVLNLLLTYYKL